MASLFKKPRSPFWYLRYKKNGEWLKASTGLRHDDPNETAQARALRAEAEAAELNREVASSGSWDWVERHIAESNLSPKSVAKYRAQWRWLAMWLTERKLKPAGVRYAHALDYLDWRIGRRKQSGKAAGRNTAIQDVKLLSAILGEAVRRGMIAANPLVGMKLRKTTPKRKPEFEDREVEICREALKSSPAWMQRAFEIALCTGCRLRETRIPMRCIDLDAKIPTITFPAPKGGEAKAFSIPCPEALMPLFRELHAAGAEYTIDEFPFQPSRAWQHFFQGVGLGHLTFHSLRVTKVTRLRREGVPREEAMRLVNHSSELVHLIYDRHRVQDLAAYRDAGIAGSSSSADARSQSRTNKRDPRRAGTPAARRDR
jgi:integrase